MWATPSTVNSTWSVSRTLTLPLTMTGNLLPRLISSSAGTGTATALVARWARTENELQLRPHAADRQPRSAVVLANRNSRESLLPAAPLMEWGNRRAVPGPCFAVACSVSMANENCALLTNENCSNLGGRLAERAHWGFSLVACALGVASPQVAATTGLALAQAAVARALVTFGYIVLAESEPAESRAVPYANRRQAIGKGHQFQPS